MFGSVSKMLGGMPGVVSKVVGSSPLPGGIATMLSGVLGDVGKLLEKNVQGSPFGALQGDLKSLAQKLGQGAARAAGSAPQVDLSGMLAKSMFIHVLTEAADDAAKKQHFNVETAINDLWVKLDRVRPNHEQTKQLMQAMEAVTGLMKNRSAVMTGIVQNLR